ncbi:MAG TPA: AP2 domain-containing protein, partial [Tepidisphaeraceae bacterium]|nr:AP2 domain-containing protein [Tepidisphaeraceae bacterium]
AVAYDEAARELFGEHARLNFPDGVDPAALREAMETENYEAPFPPPGMMGRHEACRVFEVSITTWVVWERKGRVQCGQWVPVPGGKPGRCKVYPIDEINRLLEEYQRIGKPYADPDRAGCCRVPLRSLIHQYEAIISAEDLPLVEGRNWNWAPRSNSESGRVTLATMTGPQTPLCRIITGANGYGARVMHLNGDPLDCRRENLIVRTCAEQTYTNRKRSTTNGEPCSSRYKGVSWDRKREKWVAQIVKDKQHHHLGRFGDELAAAEAYDEAARELFGEHARLNFPEGVDVALAA